MTKLWVLLMGLFFLMSVANADVANTTMRDPTQPSNIKDTAQSVGKSGLVVSSIVYGKYRKHAIVNGEVVGVGDKIGDIEVVAVDPDSVRFKDAEGEFDVPLLKLEVKTFKDKKE